MVYCGPLAPIHPSGLPIPSELTDGDCDWIRYHLELAGCQPPTLPRPETRPAPDTSWIRTERVRG